ncbi:MAG: hypothetical protein JKY93_03070 [Gammaproteobacteria bacterium]|nr:hypothetical protein [Gammaproteobacteria bacterium]
MSVLSLTASLAVLMAVFCILFTLLKPQIYNLFISIFALLVVVVHLIIEGYSWQFVPLYFVSVVLTVLLLASTERARSEYDSGGKRIFVKVGKLLLALTLVLAIGLSSLSLFLFPIIHIPKPTGEYLVGTQTLYFTDTERFETFTEEPNDHRRLRVRAWYPIDSNNQNQLAMYWENSNSRSRELTKILGLPAFLFSHLGNIETNSHENAAMTSSSGDFPLILFSHGAVVGYAEQNTPLMEELASHGYIVFSIDHSYMGLYSEFPDGSFTTNDPFLPLYTTASDELDSDQASIVELQLKNSNTLAEIYKYSQELMAITPIATEMYENAIKIWSDDQKFIISEAIGLNTAAGQFNGKIDESRIGIIGMSMGAFTSFHTFATDTRVTAGVNLDGYSLLQLNHAQINKPYMYMDSAQYFLDSNVHSMVVKSLEHSPRYLFKIDSAEHYNFSDVGLFSYQLFASAEQLGEINPLRMNKVVNRYVTAFFNEQLLGIDEPLLSSQSLEFPEVVLVQ